MSEERLTLGLDVDSSNAEAELDDFRQKVEEVGSRWERIKLTINNEIRGMVGVIKSVISLAQSIANALGMTLDPFQEYIIGLISITLTTMAQMAVAATATGIGAPLGVAIAVSAGIFGAVAHTQAYLGLNEARNEMNKVNAVVRDMGSLVRSIGGLM